MRCARGTLDRGVDNILAAFSERPFIINLGHGGVAGGW